MKGDARTRAEIPYGSEKHIFDRAMAYPRIGRIQLAETLQYELEWLHYDVPSLEVLKRKISDYRRNTVIFPQDLPWSLGSLGKFPVASDALPAIMAFYKKRLAEGSLLSIREALWTARLYRVIDPPSVVWGWAHLYASEERLSDVMGKEVFNSRALDLEIAKNPHAIPPFIRDVVLWNMAAKYNADPFKLKDLNLSMEETEEIVKSNPEKFRLEKTITLFDWDNEDTNEFMARLNAATLEDGSIHEWIKANKRIFEDSLTADEELPTFPLSKKKRKKSKRKGGKTK